MDNNVLGLLYLLGGSLSVFIGVVASSIAYYFYEKGKYYKNKH